MRFVSLFAGSGGFDLGLERAGHECVLQVELHDYRAALLKRHWPEVALVRDVRDVRDGEPLQRGEADLICGGFPCRDLSVVGRRRGLEAAESEDGSGLFFELVRVADDLLRPGGWLLIENVTGLLSSAGGRDFAVLLRTLGDIGFHDLAWRVLDSRLHGVPQSRRRVFILARRAAGSSARRVLLDGPLCAGDSQAGGDAGQGAPGGPGGGDPEGGLADLIDRGEVTRALTARLGTSGWDLTDAEGNLMVAEPGRVRRLTPTECERLQGFPDGWTLLDGPSLRGEPSWYEEPRGIRRRFPHNPRPHGPRYEAMGRAVTVPVAEAIGRRLW